ncbi:MAG: DUF4097 family beta strand repeat-containing protein [Dehalococcoidia bacterium]
MAKTEGTFEKELEVKVPLRLEVATGSGDISVQRREDGKLTVTLEFQVRAGSQEEAEQLARRIKEDPPIEVEGDLVRVGGLSKYELGTWPLGPSAVFDFSISAPFETEVRVNSGSGDEAVRSLKGPVTAKTGSGDVQIQDVEGNVAVDTGSGDIAVVRVRSRVSADAGSGDLDLTEVEGEVSVRVGSGDVHLQRMGGNMNVAIGSGDVSLESAVADGVEWVLKAGSGDVGLLLPRDSRFNISARSVLGEIETDFGLQPLGGIGKRIEGKVGENPTSSITVKTAHGDIKISSKKESPVAG